MKKKDKQISNNIVNKRKKKKTKQNKKYDLRNVVQKKLLTTSF